VGRELLKRLIDWARVKKADAIMLEMRLGNDAARPLYELNGFVEVSKRENYYGPGLTAVVMRKELK
jgi:N6-L-threonylcarbamoyladenine synthase/ribosomal-protein-alanine N-acetyltransferase